MSVTDDGRRQELAAALAQVRARIDAAARSAGRPGEDLALVVVTKTWPVSDIEHLVELGVRELGENRDDEAADKRAHPGVGWPEELRWHMVGQVQSRKAAGVARWADVVHSIDRTKIVRALGRAVRSCCDDGERDPGWELDCFVQVSLDGDPDRGGARITDVPALAEEVVATTGLRLAGVMAVPPQSGDAEAWFALLAEVAGRVRASHPGAWAISAGMSGDLEVAVSHGATHLRVGTAILGRRPPRG